MAARSIKPLREYVPGHTAKALVVVTTILQQPFMAGDLVYHIKLFCQKPKTKTKQIVQ